ncbi:MAG: DEAD/DEAH box helicase [Candidatus Moeniiplasma glomeromycotorum]|nr:DEAD/DEAH box helicase [Candidatus Moeniiplasma glomeromycotorum]MCE8168037.1 DEAD/DEAH box helicase [Candidatus Moeniiplasma glomeromycotorum]MCE8169554.1 DEAD/DEAH box helicase [Candidatus Moeniiplasma glomeromycotorum]
MNLENTSLSEKIKNRLIETGYQKLTDIQLKVIPLILEKKDVVAQSRTGTGKTAAFLIPILDADFWKQKKHSQPQVLILEPTRELALQVSKEAQKLAPVSSNLKVLTVYGQSSLYLQTQSLKKGVDIVVGTMGRVKDHLEKQKSFQIKDLKVLILDEVDEMLNESFEKDVRETIIKNIPSTCQILLFSATVSPEVKNFAQRFLKNPLFVVSQPEQVQVNNIQQYYLKVDSNKDKKRILVDLIESLNQDRRSTLTLVFINTIHQVRKVTEFLRDQKNLRQKGLVIDLLHGGRKMHQRKREKILEKFRKKQISLLVATDVAGRGIHVDDIDYVINYEIPQNPAFYTHRIGRTGRAGSKGVAITLVSGVEVKELLKIARRQGLKVSDYELTSQKNEDYSKQ